MRDPIRAAAALAAFLLASPAATSLAAEAGEFVPFHELKANSDGLVQEALGVLPNSSLGGTLNRISALNSRKPIRDLVEELGGQDATSEQLPDSYEKGMEAALLDLQDDLAAADDAFGAFEVDCVVVADPADLAPGEMDCRAAKFVLLQLVKQVVVNADAEIAPETTNLVCYDSDGNRCDLSGERQVDDVTRQLFETTWINDVDTWLMDRDLPAGVSVDGNRATDLQTVVDDRAHHVHGEPIIDWSIIHGEPIIDL